MARILTEGFELGSLDVFIANVGQQIITSSFRSGLRCMYSHTSGNYPKISLGSDYDELYIRTVFKTGSVGNLYPIVWLKDGTVLGQVKLDNASRKFFIYTGTSTLVATGSIYVNISQWTVLEVHVKIADSGGEISIKVNGIADPTGTYAGDTKPGSDTTINVIGFNDNNSCANFYTDDVAVNDTSGLVDNSWCGDGYVIALQPDSSGDSSDFVGSDSDSVDNYALVDDIPSDSDTTYVESATPDDCDLYNLEACGIDSDVYEIKRIFIEGMGKDTTTGSGIIVPLIKTSGSEIESDQVELTTSYAHIKSEEWVTNPMTGSAWTPTEVDALQIGIKVVQ